MNDFAEKGIRKAKRIATAVIGGTVLLVGLAMVVLPGPAVVVVPIGLTILATEFVWARKLLKKVKAGLASVASRGKTESNVPDKSSRSPDSQ